MKAVSLRINLPLVTAIILLMILAFPNRLSAGVFPAIQPRLQALSQPHHLVAFLVHRATVSNRPTGSPVYRWTRYSSAH